MANKYSIKIQIYSGDFSTTAANNAGTFNLTITTKEIFKNVKT